MIINGEGQIFTLRSRGGVRRPCPGPVSRANIESSQEGLGEKGLEVAEEQQLEPGAA